MNVWERLVSTACLAFFLPICMSADVIGDPRDKLRIHVLDVGQADCIVIESPHDGVMVVDIGEDSDRSGKEAEVLHKYLKDDIHRGAIDYLLISHYHEDHMGCQGRDPQRGLDFFSTG